MVGVSSPPPKPRDGGTAPRGVCGPGAGSPLGRRPQAPVGGGAGGGLFVRRSQAPLGALAGGSRAPASCSGEAARAGAGLGPELS